MRRPKRHPAITGAAAILIASAAAHAQRLNLDSPAAPPPGETVSTRPMKALPPHAVDRRAQLEDSELGIAARGRTHQLVRALVARGEALGEAGSVHIACAMTLLADMTWPLALGDRARQPGGELHAATLRAYIRAIGDIAARDGKVPDEVAALDLVLRELFAPITEVARPSADPHACGWVAASPVFAAPSVADLEQALHRAAATLPDEQSLVDLLDMLKLIDEASAMWSFAPAAADARATLAGALPIVTGNIDGTPGLPDWFPAAQRGPFTSGVAAALRAFAQSARNDDAAATLHAAALVRRLCAWADTLSPAGDRTARDIQTLRQAIADTAAEAVGNDPAPRERARKALRALERVLALIDERAALGSDTDVAQSLRTSFRALDAAAKRSESQLIAQVASIARAESATSQPGVVSAIAAHRRALDDLQMLRMVDGLLTRHRDDQSPVWRLVSSRLTRLGQEVSKATTMEAALLELRDFAAAMELQEPFTGEPAIRAAATNDPLLPTWDASSINALTGNRAAAIVARIDELRAAYLDRWAREGDERRSGTRPTPSGESAATAAARLRNLRSLCAWIDDVRTIRALGTPAARTQRLGLLAWRGLPISASTAEWLAGGAEIERLTADAAAQTLDPSAPALERAQTALRRIEREQTVRRLIARLDREARAHGVIAVPPYASLASPPTRGAWMYAERNRLAAIARYLDDAAAAAQAGDSRRASEVMRYVEMLAAEVP